MEDFQIDTGRKLHRQELEVVDVQTTIRGFTMDTSRQRISEYNRDKIKETLLDGWGLKGYRPHSVVKHEDLPTGRTITEAFRVSLSTSYDILKTIRDKLFLHLIDEKKRAERGDWLQKFQRQIERDQITQTSLRVFFEPKNEAKRIKRTLRGH